MERLQVKKIKRVDGEMRELSEILKAKKVGSKELCIITYKGKFNYWLLKKLNMDKYIEEHTVDECEKYKTFFSNIMAQLDICIESLEALLERKLEEKELAQGFEL